MNKHAKFGWRTFLLALSLASLIGAQGADSNQTNCVPTATGLAVWLPFDQSTTDVVSGSNAVLFGTPLYTAGRVGSALRLDGVDDAARAMARSGLDIGAGSGLTIEAWIRPENVQTPGALAEWSDNASLLGVHFYVASSTPGSLFANLIDTNGITHSFSSPSGLVATGQWQHVAVTYERSNGLARLFLNGTSVVEQVLGSFRPQTRPDLQIGRRVAGGANYHFRGGLDELSLYHHALSVDEIAQIAQAGSNGKCLTNTPPPPPQTNCVVAGLVSWWRGDGNANDAMGNNPGQLRNGAGFAPGMVGQGFNLNGSGQHILVPDSATLDLTNELTVELWFKADDFNGRPLFDKRNGSGPCNYGAILANGIGVELYYNDPTVADGDYPGSGFEISAHPSLPSAGVFHHFGSTFRQTGANSVELNYYLDGALVRSRTIAGNLAQAANGAPLSIGTEGAGAGAMFKGVIDEVSLYNRALSLAEMQFIHAAGSAGKCPTNTPPPPSQTNCVPPATGLAVWLPFDQSAADVVSGSNVVLTGMPLYTTGQVGSALRLDGVDDAARAVASSGLDIGAGSGLTIEAWIRPENVQSPGALAEWSDNASLLGLHFYVASSTPGSLFANLIDTNGNAHSFSSPSGLVVTGQWQHVALTYERSNGLARLFLNGTSVVQQAMGSFRPQTRPDLQIGRRALGGGAYRFRGGLDELSLYHRALSGDEIAQIAQAGGNGKCLTNTPPPPPQTNCALAGLVSWWRGDGDATDSFGNNPGQLRNGAGFAPGMVGQGFNLNGSGQYVLVPDSATLDLTNELTVELWFKADDFNGRPLFDKRNGNGPCNYGAILANGIGVELYYNDPTVADGDYPGSGFEISAHPALPSAGVFHHFGSTFRQTGTNSVELNYYLDGSLVRSRTIAGSLARAANGAPLSIGTEGAGAGAVFKGVIDEVSLYNRALSLAEMQFIHAAGSAGKCSTNTPPPPSQTNCVLAVAGLSAWLPLEGNAEDVIGGGLGILNGSPAFVAGKVAQGLRFDGQDDFVRLPASAATDIGAGSGVTIEMWINPQQLNSSAALVEWSPSTGSAVGLHLFAAQLSPGSLYANLIDTSGASHTFTSPSGVLSAGVFQHIALSYDRVSGLARFYVNGIQVASNNVGNLRLETRTDLRLGQRVLGGTPYRFTGVMDEVSLYNRALSQAELAAIYQAGEGGKCPNDLPTPPSQVRVVSVAAPSGGIASVPVQVNARGDENALGFSLEFNSSVLTFHSAAPALGLPPGATLIVNTNEAVAGRVGIILALAANSALPAGTQEVVRIAFQTVVTLNAVTTPVNFGGAPVAMQVSDALARPVPANYLNGNVVVAEGEFEADTAPRPGGDRMLAVIDWVQLGRFVVGADAVLSNEFQRADCAPRDSKGNGVISTADFVQAGRFVAGLDPLTASGGPVVPSGGAGGFQPAGAPACTVSALNTTTVATGSFTVPIRVNAHGTENALGLSIVFDPTKMTLAGVVLGADAMSGSLNLNTAHQASGKVGVLLALPSGQTLNVGVNEVLQLNFVAANAAIGNSLVSFGDEPVLREAVNANADVIPSTFVAGTVTFVPVVPPGPPITYNRDGAILYLSWPASATGFELEGATAFGAPWTTISESFTLGGQKIAIVPATGSQRFFRLRKP